MASDVVQQACGKVKLGKPEMRILAWLVADAMGAVRPIEKKLADVVGLRLERQAAQVRAEIKAVKEEAAGLRTSAQVEVHVNPTMGMAEGLPGYLATLSKRQEQELQKPYSEVYIGFWELEEVLPEVPVEVESTCMDCDHVVSAPCHLPEGDKKYELSWYAKKCWPGHEAMVIGGPPIHRLLADRLGEEGCRRLEDFTQGVALTGAEVMESRIPLLVSVLTEELAHMQRAHEEDVRMAVDCAVADCEANVEQGNVAQISELSREVARLTEQVAEARGRESALHEVIKRYLPANMDI